MSHETNNPSVSGKLLDAETWDALKASGYTEDELLADQPFGPIIFSYTRAQAIEDGVLVDLTGEPSADAAKLVRQAGFKLPVAMTMTAFCETINAGTTETDDGEFVFPTGQSLAGRLWDVLMMLRHAIAKSGGNTDRVFFKVAVDANGDGGCQPVELWSLIGPGDTPEPVLTIMLLGED